jgi:rRNA-processing protein CGR1
MTVITTRRNVSGRPWKSQQEPARAKARGNASRIGFAKRQEILKKDRAIIDMIKEQKMEKEALKLREKEMALERKKRKEENERKAEVLQNISAAKLRRMKKKQLRTIKK